MTKLTSNEITANGGDVIVSVDRNGNFDAEAGEDEQEADTITVNAEGIGQTRLKLPLELTLADAVTLRDRLTQEIER